jgi:UDP:flavonoid glycosyltransferase YjiC (YdhE family)
MARLHLLICCTPAYGHFSPLKAIARDLVLRGFDVSFLTASTYHKTIEEIGATFYPLSGEANFTEVDIESRWPERRSIPRGVERLAYDFEKIFINSIPPQHDAVQKALKDMNEKDPHGTIVVLNEMVFLGMIPTMRRAPGYHPKGVIGIGIVPLTLSSVDLPPFGPGLLPDRSPEAREQYKAMSKEMMEGPFSQTFAKYQEVLKELGVEGNTEFPLDASVLLPDRFLQCCIPSLEHYRSDAPANLRFIGGIPKTIVEAWDEKPDWWGEVVNNAGKKRILFVAQGTVTTDLDELVIPTMAAMQGRDDILVVVSLCVRGATLPSAQVPSNARVSDWIPYDWVLPYCDVFLATGGYGSLQHSVYNGIPMVIAGATEDKPEVAVRGEIAGMAVNMRTATPTADELRVAVDTILSEPKYKKRSIELMNEMKSYDPMAMIVEAIQEVATAEEP